MAQTIHCSYPNHGIEKVRDFYNPLANLLRSVKFSYLSPFELTLGKIWVPYLDFDFPQGR